MMNERKAINVFSNSTSSSRLSPLAPPFMIKNPYNHHGLLSSSSVDQPPPSLSLGGQGHRGYYSVQSDATSVTAVPCVDNDVDVELNSGFTCYPLEESPLQNHIPLPSLQTFQSSCISRASCLGHVGTKTEYENSAGRQGREILHNNNYIGGVSSLSCTNLLEQGTTVEGSKLISDMHSLLHGKVTLDLGKGNRIRPEENEKINTDSVMKPFSTSSDLLFSHRFQDTQETLVSCTPTYLSRSIPLIVNSHPLDSRACSGNNAVSNMATCLLQNPADAVVCNNNFTIEKGEKRRIFVPFHNVTKNPSIRLKPKFQTACANVPEDLNMEQSGAKPGILDDKYSTNHDDLDVDSPCWKGTQSYKSPFQDLALVNLEETKGKFTSKISVPLRLEHSKNGTVAHSSLNPLAPVFTPINSKQKVDHPQKECHEDSLLTSQMLAADRLRDYVREGVCSSESVPDAEIQCPNDTCDSKKENGIPVSSFGNSVVNSSCSFQSYCGKEYVTNVTCEHQLVGGQYGSFGVIIDATCNGMDVVEGNAHNEQNGSCSFLTNLALNSHSHSVGADVFLDSTETLKDPSQYTPPKINVKLMINTLHCLSELLLKNSSIDLCSLSEHEYDKLLKIINNLYAVVQNKAGKMAADSESKHPRTLHSHGQSADHCEGFAP